jgi:uridine kinase
MQNSNNGITITISGEAGSGRTTLAYYLARLLTDDGFVVVVNDNPYNVLFDGVTQVHEDKTINDMLLSGNDASFYERLEHVIPKLAEHAPLIINTIQTARCPSY